MNKLSLAGVLAENMLFATLDNTVRRVQLLKGDAYHKDQTPVQGVQGGAEGCSDSIDVGRTGGGSKGPEILLTDTVGFIR